MASHILSPQDLEDLEIASYDYFEKSDSPLASKPLIFSMACSNTNHYNGTESCYITSLNSTIAMSFVDNWIFIGINTRVLCTTINRIATGKTFHCSMQLTG